MATNSPESIIQVEPDACYVADSTLPKAGKGLFASKDLNKDAIVVEYTGEILNFRQAKTRRDRSYMKAVGLDRHIDAADASKSSVARYVNDVAEETKRNCKFIQDKGRVFVKTTREVKKDEELFIEYGRGHWLYCEDLAVAESFLGLKWNRDGLGGVYAATAFAEVRTPLCVYSSLHWKRRFGSGLGAAIRKQSETFPDFNCRLQKNPLIRGTVFVQSIRPIAAGEELILDSAMVHDPSARQVGFYITGFGKFQGVPENPTTRLMNNLKPYLNELGVMGSSVWETSIEGVRAGLEQADAVVQSQYSPGKNLVPQSIVYVHFGVDDSASYFALEYRALNSAHFGIPDERGAQPLNELISCEDGPDWSFRRTALDLEDVCNRLRALGHPRVAISQDAGRYICNYAYYSSLNSISGKEGDWGHDESLFVHVPSLRVIPEEKQLRFARDLLTILAKHVLPSRNAFNLVQG